MTIGPYWKDELHVASPSHRRYVLMVVGLKNLMKEGKRHYDNASTTPFKGLPGPPRRHVYGKPYVAVTPLRRYVLMVVGRRACRKTETR